jgi:CrcB protein
VVELSPLCGNVNFVFMNLFIDICLIAVSAALGALTRTGVSHVCRRILGDGFPLGTLLVNVTGCFLLGLLVACGTPTQNRRMYLALASGFLGSLTTFSTFGLETVSHAQRGNWHISTTSVLANLVLGFLAVFVGLLIGSKIHA